MDLMAGRKQKCSKVYQYLLISSKVYQYLLISEKIQMMGFINRQLINFLICITNARSLENSINSQYMNILGCLKGTKIHPVEDFHILDYICLQDNMVSSMIYHFGLYCDYSILNAHLCNNINVEVTLFFNTTCLEISFLKTSHLKKRLFDMYFDVGQVEEHEGQVEEHESSIKFDPITLHVSP
ncbi:hypothetical protein ACJX0J_030253, partial [Zea mays]